MDARPDHLRVETGVSRRREKAWEEFIREHYVGGGEEYVLDWESAARALGVPVEDFMEYNPEDGYTRQDEEGLRNAVRDAFDEPEGSQPPPLVMVSLKCQRCDRRIDTWRVRASRWTAPKPGETGWSLDNLTVTSERWANEIGDSISQLFRHFEGRSMSFDCACGRKDIQFSVRRLLDTLNRLTPDKPRWGHGDDDAYILWPATRHETIRG